MAVGDASNQPWIASRIVGKQGRQLKRRKVVGILPSKFEFAFVLLYWCLVRISCPLSPSTWLCLASPTHTSTKHRSTRASPAAWLHPPKQQRPFARSWRKKWETSPLSSGSARQQPKNDYLPSRFFSRRQLWKGLLPLSTTITGPRGRTTTTTLRSMSLTSSSLLFWLETTSAVSTWTGSAFLGYILEQRVVRDSGILVTLAVSALICPPSPILRDLCWNCFLPASLALLLLSLGDGEQSQEEDDKVDAGVPMGESDHSFIPPKALVRKAPTTRPGSTAQAIQRLTVPFVLASIGSFLGALLTFGLCCALASTTTPWHGSSFCALLPPHQARIALSCITASFIGGSVNFFSTANIILASSSNQVASTTALVSSVAAADVVVMAIYFAALSSAVASSRMRNWFAQPQSKLPQQPQQLQQEHERSFSSGYNITDSTQISRNLMVPQKEKLEEYSTSYQATAVATATRVTTLSPQKTTNRRRKQQLGWMDLSQATLVACSTTLLIVRVASWVEGHLSSLVPGLACAVIAVLTRCLQHPQTPLPWRRKHWYREGVPQVARPLSQISFLLLFSCLGSSLRDSSASVAAASTNVSSWFQSGPACIILSLLVLAVHCAVTLFGSRLWVSWQSRNSVPHKSSWQHNTNNNNSLSLDDVLVASNAAIGGPATAAAFCGRIPQPRQKQRGDHSSSLGGRNAMVKGLTYAATFWGVVGYAVGTTSGVLMYQFLGWIMQTMNIA